MESVPELKKRKRGPQSASEKAGLIRDMMTKHLPTKIAILTELKQEFEYVFSLSF
jgi:hypothetical protein